MHWCRRHFTEERRRLINLFTEKKLHSIVNIQSGFLQQWNLFDSAGRTGLKNHPLEAFTCIYSAILTWEEPGNYPSIFPPVLWNLLQPSEIWKETLADQQFIPPLDHSLICLHSSARAEVLWAGSPLCNCNLRGKRLCMMNSHLHQTLLSSSHFLCPLPLTWNWTLPLCFILSWKQGNATSYMSIWPLWTRKKLSNVMPCGSIKPVKDAAWILAVLAQENML